MVVKKIPMRTCVVTREQFPKMELIRVLRTPEGTVTIDTKGKANGRGAYLKKSIDAVNKAKKSNCLGRALECNIPETLYEELIKIVS